MSSARDDRRPSRRREGGGSDEHAAADPQRLVRATFDGEPLEAERGASIAAALVGSGCAAWRVTRAGERRGLFCGIGVCFDCLVEVDGESGQRACMIPIAEGMRIRSTGSSAGGAS